MSNIARYHLARHLFALVIASSLITYAGASKFDDKPLQTGWHDELNTSAIKDWSWQPPKGRADLSVPAFGTLRLTLGDSAQEDKIGKDTYYWATCARYATVDLDRYPILAVHTLRITGQRHPWWDVTVNDYKSGENLGPDIGGGKHDTKPGLLLFDVKANSNLSGKRQIRLRLSVAGLDRGAYVDYAYVRFIRREDRSRLEKDPDLQDVVP
jgi:hypothetical protein